MIKIVQLQHDLDGWQLTDVRVKAISFDTDDPRTKNNESCPPEMLRQVIRDMGLEGASVAIAISGPSVIMKPLDMPWMSDDELAGHLEWEVERYLPYEREDVYWDYFVPERPQRDRSSAMRVYLVAAKKDMVDQRVGLVKEAGFVPVVVDLDCVALANMHALNVSGFVEAPELVINVGPSGLNIITVGGGEYFAMRDATLGGDWSLDLLKESVPYLKNGEAGVNGRYFETAGDNVELEDVCREILYEVRRAIDDCHSCEGGQMVQQVWISGGYAHLPGLVASLSSHLHVPVNIIDPFRNINCTAMEGKEDKRSALSSVAAVAVGLALRCNHGQ
ncbi:MAG: hypothetical protein NPIRA02_36890 [Nitrospirales bacterium]|nr:MAG: hypothetical protein NPIRA02_36890 [Nitrospirales bacterium]